MNGSPVEQLLEALDRLDLEGVLALMAPDPSVLVLDGRRAEGSEAVRQLFTDFLAQLRSTTHRVTAQWHSDDFWIAETDTSYELRDWLRLDALPRVYIIRAGPAGISELRAYGAYEQQLSDRFTDKGGIRVGGQWMPPL